MTVQEMSDLFPEAPQFSEQEWDECRKRHDYRPILFEWYKYAASLVMIASHIMPESPACKKIEPLKYYILAGLLSRCARLMLSNVALSHTGKFGETTSIIDRCIFESAVKIRWFCANDDISVFHTYCLEGLKTESALKRKIIANIDLRDGVVLPIEERMLDSIKNHFDAAGVSEEKTHKPKRLPKLDKMIDSLGDDELLYITGQKLGSHHVHGTWPSLLFHYLEEREEYSDFRFGLRGHDCETHTNQYIYIPLVVIGAAKDYLSFLLLPEEEEAFRDILDKTKEEIYKVASLAWREGEAEDLSS